MSTIKIFEVSANMVPMAIAALKSKIRPDALILGTLIKVIEENFAAFDTPIIKITIEGMPAKSSQSSTVVTK